MRKRLSLVAVMALLVGSGAFLRSQDGMTLLLVNGKFWTVNPQQKEAEAVAIRGNRIAAVGTHFRNHEAEVRGHSGLRSAKASAYCLASMMRTYTSIAAEQH